MTTTNKALIALALLLVVTMASAAAPRGDRWTDEEVAQLSSMSLRELGAAPADPTNRVADDPHAAEFGRKLFFDTRLSANGQVSCATCHIPEKEFQDGTPLAKGVGVTSRRTMPIAGMAHSPFLFWDGRKDSLWAQALGPLESPVEHGGSREQYAKVIAAHYRPDYEAIFGDDAGAFDTRRGDGGVREHGQGDRRLRADDRVRAVALRPLCRNPAGHRPRAPGRAVGRRSGRPAPLHRQGELRELPQRPAAHEQRVPQHRRAGARGTPGRQADVWRAPMPVLRDEFNCRSRWSDSRSRCAELEFLVTATTCWSARSRCRRCEMWRSARPTCTPVSSAR